jgi:hypothetical protein
MLASRNYSRWKDSFRRVLTFQHHPNVSKTFSSSSYLFKKEGKGTKRTRKLETPVFNLREKTKEVTNSSAQSLFKPVTVMPNPDDIDLGEEIAGKISKQALLKQLNLFYQDNDIKA